MNLVQLLTGDISVQVVTWIAVATPLILGLVQVIKQWISNSRWHPIISILIGIILGIFFGGFSTIEVNILVGVLAGLGAAGLYSGSKTVSA